MVFKQYKPGKRREGKWGGQIPPRKKLKYNEDEQWPDPSAEKKIQNLLGQPIIFASVRSGGQNRGPLRKNRNKTGDIRNFTSWGIGQRTQEHDGGP